MKGAASTTSRRANDASGVISAHHEIDALLTREYQTIFKNNGKPMVIVEADATISLANAEFEQLSGYTKKEIEGKKSWTEFVMREDRRRVKEYHRLRSSDPMLTPRCFEFRFLDRQGQIRNIVLTIGEIPGTHRSMASLQDITERRRNEREQRASEERYKILFENSRDAIYISTPNGIYVDANRAALMLFGYTREEMKRVNISQLYAAPADARRFQREIEEKGFVQDFAARLYRKDGTEMECFITATAQRGDDGSILEYHSIIRDITEHRQREELLQHEKEIFFTILDHSPHGVIVLDEKRRYIYVNPEFTTITGYTLENTPTGKEWILKAFPDAEYRQKVIDTWRGDIAKKRFERAFHVVCGDGSVKEIEFSGMALESAWTIVMLSDITERKRMQEKLQESEEHYRILVNNIRFGINLINTDYTIIMVNTAQEKHFKKAAAQFVGKRCFREFEKRDAVCPHCPAVQAIATKKPAEVDTILTADDGGHLHVRVQVFPIVAQDGTVTSFIEIAEIITERKEAEMALRESEEHFKMLADSAPFGISIMAPDRRFEYFNPKFIEIFGYTREDMPDKDTWLAKAYPDAEYRNKVTGLWERDREEGVKIGKENPRIFAVRCKNGTDKIIDFRTVYLKDGRQYLTYEDITERERMEEQLRQSEERFRKLVETMRVGLSAVDAHGVITYVNDQMCQMLGYTTEELIGHPTIDFYDEKSRKLQEERFAQRRKGLKDPTPYEVTWIAKDGHRINTIITPTPGFSPHGEFTGSFAIFTDITERKLMEEQLRHKQQELQALMDASPVGVCWADMQGNIQYANRKFSELFGYTVEDIPDIPTWRARAYPDPAHREQVPSLISLLTEAKKQGRKAAPIEITITCKDGSTRHVLQAGAFASNRIFVTYDDITERKLMEEQLQKSEALHRSLIETTGVGVSAINENGVIIYANDRHCEIWGYPLNEIMGHRVSEFLDEENLKILQDQMAERREGSSESYEISWRRKNGQNVSTILAPTPIFDAEGHFKGSYGFITDITERKRIEERLQRYAADLEHSNEEIKNFAYIVSHDLRVPLVNLKGYSAELGAALKTLIANFEAVLTQLPEGKKNEVALALHEDIPEALEFITNSVSRMDHFINAVLLLSRLGRRDLKPEHLAMDALVKHIVEGMSHQIQEKGITVNIAALPEVIADRTSMEQIMGNILGNAVKYLEQGRPGTIEVTGQANGSGETTFRIRDNGRGIAADDMEKVFAPFRRAGKQDTPGEGMGLAYVQTLVRRHNGRIRCESELGKGTTFTFTIANEVKQGARHG